MAFLAFRGGFPELSKEMKHEAEKTKTYVQNKYTFNKLLRSLFLLPVFFLDV
jgi:hypothetical protein